MERQVIAVVAVLACWCVAVALASGDASSGRMQLLTRIIGRTDANEDGIIAKDEVQAIFNGYDDDNDGTVDWTEWFDAFVLRNPQLPTDVAQGIAHGWFSHADIDGNGALSEAEMVHSITDTSIDRNGDGMVSVDELRYYLLTSMSQAGQPSEPSL